MINILTTNNCVQCKYTKQRLDDAHVDYREIDISRDEHARELLQMMGVTSLPVVMWGGFKLDALNALGRTQAQAT